ncbi:MAG: hypothetical protein JWN80_2812 [Microbacteriaceae bacterium]|nr:hypothetical protein [Microbacteriaceae bacterium]
MLFVVAALTSGALGGVSEAFGVHENNTFTTNITQPVNPSGQEISGAVPVVLALPVTPYANPTSHDFSTLTGTSLLVQLSTLPQTGLTQFAKANPETIKKLMTSPPAAASVTSWWSSLSTAGQARFSKSLPQMVGNLDGVPFTVRDSVNREYLSTAIASARTSLSSGIGRAKLVSEKHHLEILEQIARTLAPSKSKSAPVRQLLTFDPTGNARAAVSVGNVETADYVTYLVPGMFFTVQGQVYDWTTIAQQLHSQQDSWLKTLAKTDPSYRGKTAATVAWIGYSTPGVLDIASLNEADQGANLLGSAIHGVQAVRANSMPYITVVAHSYGSTAAMIELSKGDVTVNALAMIGSPGAAAQTASSLSVSDDNVFVGEAAWDPVVNTAFYGSDPGSAAFGAKTMDVAAATDPITGKKLAASVGHLGYFDSGTTAMRNLALIGLGQGSLVLNGTTQDASRTLGTTQHASAPAN